MARLNLITRINAFLNPNLYVTPQKSYANLFDFFGYGSTDARTGNLLDNNYGYAQAYLSVLAVRQAVDYYAASAQGIPTQIVKNTTGDPNQDEIIARSDDVKPNKLWYEIARYHRQEYGIGAIMAMVYNMILYDAIFVEKIRNVYRYPSHVRVLNTLGVTPMEASGEIISYQYSWNGESIPLNLDDVSYEHGFNPIYDLRGASLLQSVMSKIQIERNLDRFLQAFFNNNATLGIIGSPRPNTNDALGDGSLSPEQTASLRKIINDWHTGVKNAFRPLILNTPIDLQTIPIPEVDKYTNVASNIYEKILTAFGVNPALVGATENTSYKEDLPQIEAQFINKRLKPLLSQIETMINNDLLPFLTNSTDYRFEFDYHDYNLVTPQDELSLSMATTRLQSGTLSITEYQELTGDPVVKELEDYYIVEGVPVPLPELINLWKYKFGAQQQPAQLPAVSDGDNPVETEPIESNTETKSHHHEHDHHSHSIGNISIDKVHPDAMPGTYDDIHKQFYQDAPGLDDIKRELAVWLRHIKRDKYLKSAFVPDKTRGDIADVILDAGNDIEDKTSEAYKQALLDAVNAKLTQVREWSKAIQSTRIDYELQIEDLIEQARSKSIAKRAFNTKMMQANRAYCNLAFIDGMREGGVLGEPSEEDSVIIESHVVNQRAYVNSLADTIYDKGISDAEAIGKPAMWYNKTVAPMFEAGKVSADKNGMFEWVYGKAEHCADCINLNGQRHRMKTYYAKGILPKSDKLECNGFNCKCSLVRVSASARGTLPNL